MRIKLEVNLRKLSLSVCFLSALMMTFLLGAFYPWIRTYLFVPVLILTLYQKPLSSCLFASFFCGLFVDLFSGGERLGLYGMNWCLSLWIVSQFKTHFFADHLTTLSLMTYLFSLISSLIQPILLTLLETSFHLSWGWLWTNILLLPILDACIALCVFIVPALGLQWFFLWLRSKRRAKHRS